MFTGIIESLGIIKKITAKKSNLIYNIQTKLAKELHVNQSVAHNGVCLTVIDVFEKSYNVCVVKETIDRTNLSFFKKGGLINLERCLALSDKLDGHFVQGHVDCIAKCTSIINTNGSWVLRFQYPEKYRNYIVEKGSIAINGVSLTISKLCDSIKSFETTIIPYTFNHTNFKLLKENNLVNIEFDIIGKHVVRLNQK
tara:strand:- start:1874 stop:2464 length:591 start_codon:yes stop_codon:yes gene_type:complete